VTTIDRVQRFTDDATNRRIEAATGARIRRLVANPLGIERRLRELDLEWDIERVLETQAALAVLVGLIQSWRRGRHWLTLPGLVSTCLFQHTTRGWSPPLGLLRWLEVRTAREIEVERVALKILRGDFDETAGWMNGRVLEASRALRVARS
jgi:hypothetical protein